VTVAAVMSSLARSITLCSVLGIAPIAVMGHPLSLTPFPSAGITDVLAMRSVTFIAPRAAMGVVMTVPVAVAVMMRRRLLALGAVMGDAISSLVMVAVMTTRRRLLAVGAVVNVTFLSPGMAMMVRHFLAALPRA